MFGQKKIFKNKEKTVVIGRLGEDKATEYFKGLGYKIIERNYRSSHYEIDFIAEDKETVVFVEVKARSYRYGEEVELKYGRPATAVDKAKQKRIVAAASKYLSTHDTKGKRPRIDVIEIYFRMSDNSNEREVIKIDHIRNAFGR